MKPRCTCPRSTRPRHGRAMGRMACALALLAAGIAAVLPGTAGAMLALSENELATVNGQDGIEININSPAISITQLQLNSDSSANAGGFQADGVRLAPTGVLGDPTAVTGYWTLDAGANAQTTVPAIALVGHMDRARVGGAGNDGYDARMIGSGADVTRSFGQWALVSDIDFRVVGQPLYGIPSSTTALYLALNDATLFYRQNAYPNANIALDNFNFIWDMPAGTIDVDNDGIRIAGDATFRADFDLTYKYNADQNLTAVTINDRPLARVGWGGVLYDSLLYLRGGGIWDTAVDAGTNVAFNTAGTAMLNMPTTGRTEGINVGMRWNYRSPLTPLVAGNFRWSIGHVTGDREYVEFSDWRNLEQASGPVPNRYGFDFPLLAIDTLSAGSDTNAGGSLCWGNTMTGAACSGGGGTLLKMQAGTVTGYNATVNRTGGAAAVHLIRNGNLFAWSHSVQLYRFPVGDATPTLEVDNNTALVYTLANINSNMYFYPGGSESDVAGGSRDQGVLVDVLFMTQSFGTWQNNYQPGPYTDTIRWSHGSHFMLADTDAEMGIGLLGSSFLFAGDDMRIWLKNTSAGQASPANWDGGIDLFSPRTRTQMIALFAGARLPGGHDLIRGLYVNFNFEGLWNFRLSPPPTRTGEAQDFLAYSAAIRFRCGTTTPLGCTGNAFADAAGSTIASGQGSYMSLAEPASPAADFRVADMSGDIAWTEGTLQVRSVNDTSADNAPNSPDDVPGKPEVVIANKILVGASAAARMTDASLGAGLGAGGAAGRTLTANVTFAGSRVLSWAIPAASVYASFSILPQ